VREAAGQLIETSVAADPARGEAVIEGLLRTTDPEVVGGYFFSMGRALPRVDQFTRAVDGGALTPFAMVDPGGRTVLLDDTDPVALERVIRVIIALLVQNRRHSPVDRAHSSAGTRNRRRAGRILSPP